MKKDIVYYAAIPNLFPCFLPSCYPYILLDFFITYLRQFFSCRCILELKFSIIEVCSHRKQDSLVLPLAGP